MSQIVGLIVAVLSIVVGLWKFFRGRAERLEAKKNRLRKAANDAIDKKDNSAITAMFDRLRRK